MVPDIALWVAAIRADPQAYRLAAYEPPAVSIEGAATYFGTWSSDELAGAPAPALCRRCGRLLRPEALATSSQQLHLQCRPTDRWPQP